jgi:type I restriction enzyme S subunit
MINLKKNIWKRVELDSVLLSLKNGRNVNQFDDEGEYRVSRIQTIADGSFDLAKTKWTNDKVNIDDYLNEGDILVSHINSVEHIGKSAIVPKLEVKVIHGINLLRLVSDNKKIDNTFLFYFIKSDEFINQVLKYTKKAVNQASVKSTDIKQFQIPLPPLEDQKEIAALFQSIETTMKQVDGQAKNLKALQKSLVNGLLSKVPEFGNLLNSKNCTSTTFGEIAECDKKYPEHEKEVERFVGLEFIEADNFQLQGWGEIANGTTFSKRFVKGDVLFGKRRAYLKKVAVADFDGICSGDILVIRAKATKMLQGLLPYYISADAFINHAVSTSAGSLSPRTKWKDLETFEVSIPNFKTQERILEVLNQFETTIKQLKQQKATLKLLKQKLLNEILG